MQTDTSGPVVAAKSSSSSSTKSLGCLMIGCIGVVLFCICSFLALMSLPVWMQSVFVSDTPLDIPREKWERSEVDDLLLEKVDEVNETGEMTLTPEEMTQIIAAGEPGDELTMQLDIDEDGDAIFKLSEETQPGVYFNMEVEGDVEIENSEFTKAVFSKFMIGNFNLVSIMGANTDLSATLNDDLKSQPENPLKNIKKFEVRDGKFVYEMYEEEGL